jgi:hypothetical protein
VPNFHFLDSIPESNNTTLHIVASKTKSKIQRSGGVVTKETNFPYKAIKTIVIDNSITGITSHSFNGCTELKEVIFNNTKCFTYIDDQSITTDLFTNSPIFTFTNFDNNKIPQNSF